VFVDIVLAVLMYKFIITKCTFTVFFTDALFLVVYVYCISMLILYHHTNTMFSVLIYTLFLSSFGIYILFPLLNTFFISGD